MKVIQKTKKQMYVPIEQAEAAVDKALADNTRLVLNICEEMMLIMLHETFGFGRERCMKAINAHRALMYEWKDNTTSEFNAETFRMNYKEKKNTNVELAWCWKNHDRALEPLIDPDQWEPYTVRYAGLGGFAPK